MPYMYILKCADGTYYTGSTWDLERRIGQHNAGEGAHYTRCRLPVELVYQEYSDSIKAVFEREKQVQGWTRKKKESLMRGDSNELHSLAECMNDSHSKNIRRG